MSVWIPVEKITEISNPLKNPPWAEVKTLSKGEVLKSIKDNKFNPDQECRTKADHIKRIAYLVVNPWEDAIDIEVGVPALCCYVDWIIWDGNHRVVAAIVRGDSHIKADVGGQLDYAFDLFGLDCK